MIDVEHAAAFDVVAWTYRTFERVALVASFQRESSVLIDMACKVQRAPEVITIDTGRLPAETHTAMAEFTRRYPLRLRVIGPDPDEVASMTAAHGTELFRSSVPLRQQCCLVRKVRPLARALVGYDAWITGIRREQTPARTGAPVVTLDPGHGGITRVAPLARWTSAGVRAYVRNHQVPVHPLYAQGFTSIGCRPCTRATRPGEDERAGRWWWETDSDRECGLHTLEVTA